ncbi:autophagy protein 5 [Neltuma alba]|uniref:autophagy protein 5 n=1 Tax=Neltuma alba TaxID=207710 RepID=UPI0010A4A437|nr:autophagy protein 5 [Prosopis alba]XP_028800583.1 autophagy protein 5 [Prosopis alba]
MTDAQKYVWDGAIPLQIHLHESEVTTLPPPPPALVLAPRRGYLPLLISIIKPYFSATLPPGVDTIWFEYKGLPLKWYIPTGVLFDLLCVEPERPWNLTVHFRGYPSNILLPCESEDSVKWSFINSLKEAAYIILGNCKNVMNMSQTDQVELWQSVLKGNLDAYRRVSFKLKLGTFEDEFVAHSDSNAKKSQQSAGETDVAAQMKIGRIPVRLYVWTVSEDFDDFENVPSIDSWDKVSYINRPVEVHKEEGKYFSLRDAVENLLPEFFPERNIADEGDPSTKQSAEEGGENSCDPVSLCSQLENAEIKLVRIQGIEPKLEIPFSWVVSNLINPEHFLHICVCLKVSEARTEQ